ncbi:hypothetical protein BX600DRAFT_147483 [Xylariales sp. PMI_506]|nr:hypothetical protein BX600DRAFT_147483 [Xylariales sp. PMI_506]
MANPTFLTGLTTREAIADAITRACLAIDSNDRALWESAWATSTSGADGAPPLAAASARDEVSMVINGRELRGMDTLYSECFDRVGPMDTQHLISGLRIELLGSKEKDEEEEEEARATANALNQHFRPGQGMVPGAEHLLVGSTYDIRLVREAHDGQWRIRSWVLKSIWGQGNPEVLQG